MAWKNADVVVIGGGIIGTAITYFLARQKADVILLEKNGLHPVAPVPVTERWPCRPKSPAFI